jgi:hypothetical protein
MTLNSLAEYARDDRDLSLETEDCQMQMSFYFGRPSHEYCQAIDRF